MPAHIAGTLHATPAPVWLPYPDDVNALLPSLWSDNVTKTDDGVLTIAGRSVTELAAEYGTPTLIMDAADFRSRARPMPRPSRTPSPLRRDWPEPMSTMRARPSCAPRWPAGCTRPVSASTPALWGR